MFRFFVASFSFIPCLLSFLTPASALASAKITEVGVKRSDAGLNVDITFDKPVTAKGVKPVFERDFVQLVLKPARIDAAKMLPVASEAVAKVFAYPYSPDTARVRVILKRSSEWAKGRVSLWNNTPRTIRVLVRDAKGADARAVAKASVQAQVSAAPAIEEASLLKEVQANTAAIDIHNPDSVKAALGRERANENENEKNENEADPEKLPITQAQAQVGEAAVGAKADPSRHFTRMAGSLLAILAVFIGAALLLKKYAGGLKKLPFGKKERLIQVVATHYLGAKKSISLVKVTGEYMVVGVSNDGISLISKLGPEVNVDKYLEDRFWGGTFEKHLSSYAKDSKITKAIDLSEGIESTEALEDLTAAPTGPVADLMREQTSRVRDQVELSPVRASIKEKLTKLKPLA